MARMLLRHNEWSPPDVAGSTRRRISFLPASIAAWPRRIIHGSGIRTLRRPGRAQEEHHGVRVVGLAERQEETGEAALCDLHARSASDGGLAAGMRSDTRGDGIDWGLLEASVEHPGGAV